MGIFNFIKKLFEAPLGVHTNNLKVMRGHEPQNPEQGGKKISFPEIKNWIEKKKKDIEVSDKKVFILIKEKVNTFVNELKEKIIAVEEVDLKLKNAEGRIESASEEGRKKYLEAVEILIRKLEELEKNNLEKFSKNIDKVFLDFNKSSNISYERATILIGKEMADIKETLKIFSKKLIKMFEENQEIIDSSSAFSFIELKLDKITKINQELEKIKKVKFQLGKDLFDEEKENKKILQEIEDIKKSEDYLKNLSRQDEIKLLNEELDKEIFDLRQIIDFKALANFYHIFEDKMKLVKKYRDDFQKTFEKDNQETLADLLNESKLNNNNVSEKMKNIQDKKKAIAENQSKIKKDNVEELYSQTTKIILDIGTLKNENIRQSKRQENLRLMKKELIESVKEKVEDLGVEII
jgi:hypothetical protein